MPEEPIDGRHVLVVERDVIVGMGLAADLADLGFRVSGPFFDASEVLDRLADDPPDAAIVDISIRDGRGPEVARSVRARGVPLVLFSAGGRRGLADGEFDGVPSVEKPATIDRLLGALGLAPHPDGAAPTDR